MGASGSHIFDDDTAWDVKGIFEGALEDGCSADDAVERVKEEMSDAIEDEDDGPIIWLALACLQIEKGSLSEEVKKNALEGIEIEFRNEPGGRWEEEDYTERKKILEDFRNMLLNNTQDDDFVASDH